MAIKIHVKSQLAVFVIGLLITPGMTQAVSIVDLNILGRLHGTNDAPTSSLAVPSGFTGQIDLRFQIISTRTAPEAIDGVAFSIGASDPKLFTYVDFGGSHAGTLEYYGPFYASSYSGGTAFLPVDGEDLTHVANLAYFDGATNFQPNEFPSTGSIQLVIKSVNALVTGSYVFNTVVNPPYVTNVSYQDSMNGIYAGTFGQIGNFTLNVLDVPEPGLLGLLALGGLARLRRRPIHPPCGPFQASSQ